MTKEEKLELIAGVLSVEAEKINENTYLSDMNEYDSMTKLSLIIMFVDECNKKLNVNEINAMKSVGDIMAMMD